MMMKLPLIAGGVVGVAVSAAALAGEQPERLAAMNVHAPDRGGPDLGGFGFEFGAFGEAEGQPSRDRRGRGGPKGRRQDGPPRRGQSMERIDANEDGEIQRAELQASLLEGLERRQEAALRMFERADLNGDGIVTAEEITEGVAQRHKEHAERMLEGFGESDADGSGSLSAEERQAARTERRERFRDRLEIARERFDADGDGRLRGEERRNAGRTLRMERRLDANRDGEIDQADVAEALRRLERGKRFPDVNGDGVGDAADVQELIDRAQQPD
ncbi:MAG: dockerin type I domain-containing protein [Planctomycetota bacterium]